jgi:putative ABC transport system permease protein
LTSKLVIENLKNKPIRSLLSVLLIGVPVTLILTLVGLSHGLIEDSQRRTRAVGADIIVRPPDSNSLTLTTTMTASVVKAVEKLPHVKLATGVVNVGIESVLVSAAGIDLPAFTAMSGGVRLLDGTTFKGPEDVMVDEYWAAEKHLTVGGPIELFNRKWRVCGIYAGGLLARVLFPLPVLQDISNNAGRVSQIYVKLDDPANTGDVLKYMAEDEHWKVYKTYSMQGFLSLFSINTIPGLRAFVWVIVGVGVLIGFAVMCLSMYMAVLQRTREIGILKSLGGSNGFILRIILAEALIMGVAGTALGIGMSYGAWWLIRTLVPASIQMVIVYDWWPIALGITLFGTGFGALYPGLAAARHDPIEALAYE